MSEEALKILVPAFTAILGIFIGYFLKKSEYERQRRDERADKALSRRVQYRDKKIEEVQAYLDTFVEIIRLVVEFEMFLIWDKDNETVSEDNIKINELLLSSVKWVNAFAALNDSELTTAHDEFVEGFHAEWKNAQDLEDTIEKSKNFDTEATIRRIPEFQYTAIAYIGVMQTRIHVLAESLE